jgi:hypothetical protein
MSFSEGVSYYEVLKSEVTELRRENERLRTDANTYKQEWLDYVRAHETLGQYTRELEAEVERLRSLLP